MTPVDPNGDDSQFDWGVVCRRSDGCTPDQPATVARVPNTPGTPRRTIRIPDDLWDAAQAKSAERGENLSDVIRKALERYVRRVK